MFESNMLQNLVRGLDPVHSKTIQLRPGQVFQGTINQLYPGNLAQLQLGSTTLSAQLEAQLEKGSRYWFRVLAGEGIPRLQVLENVPAATSGSYSAPMNTQAVLQQLGFPAGGAYERILQQLNQLNLPFTRSNILEGGQLLQQSSMNQQQSTEIITSMIQRGFPLTSTVFHALAAMQSNQSMGETMVQLHSQLQSLSQGNPLNQQLQQTLASVLNQGDPTRLETTLQTLLKQVAANGSSAQQALQVVREMGIIPQNISLPDFLTQFKATVLKPENQEAVRQLWPQILQGNQGTASLQAMDSRVLFTTFMNAVRPDHPQAMQMVLQLLNPNGNAATITSQFQQWLIQPPNEQTRELWSIIQNTSKEPFFLMNGSREESPLRMMLQLFGLQHESDIRTGLSQDLQQRNIQTLKALLMQFLQQGTHQTMGARDQAEFLLNRLTGQQLISSEQQGPIQHTIFQAPLKMMDKYQDITIQWQGRETKSGAIDESHCRILFYLQLESLKETVVDVQIQNRIMTLTIFNENEKPKSVSDVWHPILKEALSEMNFQLSSIQWKLPVQAEASSQPFPQPQRMYQKDKYGYRGVDVRI